jgi:hypothetical protein
MDNVTRLRSFARTRGCKTSPQRRYSTFAYTTLLQLFSGAGRVYTCGYYVRYPVTVVGEVAWTTKNSRGTS